MNSLQEGHQKQKSLPYSGKRLDWYFANARTWYLDKYLRPYSELTYFAILTLLMLYTIYIINGIIDKQDTAVEMPFCVYNYEPTQVYHSIRALANTDRNINSSITDYLSRYYTRLRETYPMEMTNDSYLKQVVQRVEGISSIKVASQYRSSISSEDGALNPLIALYNLKQSQSINILQTKQKIAGSDKIPTCAMVAFERIRYTNGRESSRTLNIATLTFVFSSASAIYARKLPLDFQITSYTARGISNIDEFYELNDCILLNNWE